MIVIAFAATLAGVSDESSAKQYLDCRVSQRPAVTSADLYREPPRDELTIAKDLLSEGASSLTQPPPDTWIIDSDQKRIEAGPGSWSWAFEDADFGPSEINASLTTHGGRAIAVTFNRINGDLKTSFVMSDAERDAWQEKHGKPFPRIWTWTQRCTVSRNLML